MKTKPTVCALYTRVSSQNQLDNEYSSLQTQRERLEAYCRSQDNYTVYRVYEDGAYSAENINRPALKQMLADIQAGKVNCVLAYKIDRLTRSVKDFHVLMEVFDRHNVKFVSITQSLDTQHPMGRLLRNILLDFAQFEREMTADRTRDKMHQRAEKGMWNGGHVLYGYRNENKKLIKDDVEAPRVQFIFDWFAQTPSLVGLRAELHRRGWFNRAGKHWIVTALDSILRNSTYIGKIGFNELSFAGLHEPIIAEPLFKNVQSLRRERGHVATTMKRPFLLKGLLHCSDCGSAMTPHYVQKRRKDGSVNRIPYYRCIRTLKFSNGVCRVKHLNADKTESTVVENLYSLCQNEEALKATIQGLNQDLKQKIDPLEKESAQIKHRLNELETEIDRFVIALGKGTIAIERLESEIKQRENDRKTLKTRLDELEQKINEEAAYDFNGETVLKNLREFRNIFEVLNPQEKAETMRGLVKQINAEPGKLVMEVYELADFRRGSQNHPNWLSDMDSNHE